MLLREEESFVRIAVRKLSSNPQKSLSFPSWVSTNIGSSVVCDKTGNTKPNQEVNNEMMKSIVCVVLLLEFVLLPVATVFATASLNHEQLQQISGKQTPTPIVANETQFYTLWEIPPWNTPGPRPTPTPRPQFFCNNCMCLAT